MSELFHVDVDKIIVSDLKLRDVDRDDEDYLGLVESVKQDGVMNAVSLQKSENPETGEEQYVLIDGLQRLSASRDAGKKTIPAQIFDDITQDDILYKQIITNAHKIETKPVQYTKALQQILATNPLLTKHDLAASLSKSSGWLDQRLKLDKLIEQVGNMVDAGEIGLSNAYELTKIPQEEQVDFVDRAIALAPEQFKGVIAGRKRELDKAKREGRGAKTEGFTPFASVRKKAELQAALSDGIASSMISSNNITDPVEAFNLALNWALSMDSESIKVQEEQYNMRKTERERQKKNAELEKAKLDAEKAAKRAAELQQNMATA